MKNFPKVLTSVKIAAIASFALVVTEIDAFDAFAAEVRFLCADALESSMQELIPEFEKTNGHSVKMILANAGTNTERVRKGDVADLAIVLPQQWETLRQEGKIDPAVRTVIGKVGLGAFVKKGAARPDISSVEAFKHALLNARAIAVRDPSKGSPVGTYVIALFDRLGIGDDIKPKLRLTADRPYETVAKGDAEIGFSTIAEIVASPEVDLVGPLPSEIQNFNIFTTAIPINAEQVAATRLFIEYLISPRATAVFKSKGVGPG
jgi:molybdate transport system substrate-binding protein